MKIIKHTKKEVGHLDKDYPQKAFNQLMAFQGYGFNKCLDIHTLVELRDGTKVELKDVKIGDEIKSANGNFRHAYKNKLEYFADLNNIIYVKVKNIYHNKKNLYQITTNKNKKIIASLEHKFKVCQLKDLTTYMMKPLCEILDVHSHNLNNIHAFKDYYYLVTEDGLEMIDYDNIRPCGNLPTIDLQIDNENHQFFANGILVSNSHSVAYSHYAAVQLYLKRHYLLEFMCGILDEVDRSSESKGVKLLDQRVKYCYNNYLKVHAPQVNIAQNHWIIHKNELYASITNIKGLGQKQAQIIMQNRPYTCITQFLDKTGFAKSKFQTLLFAGALDEFGSRQMLYNWYYNVYLAKPKKKKDEDQMMFDFLEDDEEDSTIKISKVFSKKQLNELFFDYNGFSLKQNVLGKHLQYMEQNSKVKTVQEVLKKKTKYPLMIAKIQNATSFVSRVGKEWTKVSVTDGYADAQIMMPTSRYQGLKGKTLRNGNVVVIPVATSQSQMLFLGNIDKYQIKILEYGN